MSTAAQRARIIRRAVHTAFVLGLVGGFAFGVTAAAMVGWL